LCGNRSFETYTTFAGAVFFVECETATMHSVYIGFGLAAFLINTEILYEN